MAVLKEIAKDLPKKFNLYGRRNPLGYDTCYNLLQDMDLKSLYGDNKVQILDAYPGIGVWSAALFDYLQPKKHCAIELFKDYRTQLQKFEDPTDKRFELLARDPFKWTTFSQIIEEDKLITPEVESLGSRKLNNSLLYTANLSGPQGGQLFGQYVNCMLSGNWLFKYGRVRMLIWACPLTTIRALSEPIYDPNTRVKLSFLCELGGTVSPKMVIGSQQGTQAKKLKDLLVRWENKHAKGLSLKGKKKLKKKEEDGILETIPWIEESSSHRDKLSAPIVLLEVIPARTPLRDRIYDIDALDYVARQLMITRTAPLEESVGLLGAGAVEGLRPKVGHLYDKPATALTGEELIEISQAFYEWPFKPEILWDQWEDDREKDERSVQIWV